MFHVKPSIYHFLGFVFFLTLFLVGCTIHFDDDNDLISGCVDNTACNYDSLATVDDGSCTYVDGICDTCVNMVVVDNDADNDGVCIALDCDDTDASITASSNVDSDADGRIRMGQGTGCARH